MTAFVLLFGISGGEILIIMLVVLLLFGPSKIPEIARLIGRGMNEVKKVQREINTEIQRYSAEVEKETKKIQTDINELKEEINKGVEVDQPDEKAAASQHKAEKKSYEYDYDQYGLEDDYAKRYAQGSDKPATVTPPDQYTSATGSSEQAADMNTDQPEGVSGTAPIKQKAEVSQAQDPEKPATTKTEEKEGKESDKTVPPKKARKPRTKNKKEG